MSAFKPINGPPAPPSEEPIPGKAEFADDVETESFYVLLDVPPSDRESIQKKGPAPPVERLQILGLHSENPLISCRGEIYSCTWADTVGTGMYFLAPKASDDAEADEEANGDAETGVAQGGAMQGITAAQILAAAKVAAEADAGNDATFVGIGTMRLEGRPVNIKMAGDPQSKRKVADEGMDFISKLDQAVRRRQARDRVRQEHQGFLGVSGTGTAGRKKR